MGYAIWSEILYESPVTDLLVGLLVGFIIAAITNGPILLLISIDSNIEALRKQNNCISYKDYSKSEKRKIQKQTANLGYA